MDWLQLLTPSLAILALFAAIALLVLTLRHGRAIRRLEERLDQSGVSPASQAALDRIAQLQARAAISQGDLPPPRRSLRPAAIGGVSVVVVALVAAGAWLFFFRDDDGRRAAGNPGSRPPASAPTPPRNQVPATVPPLENKANYVVAVLNGSGVEGAARSKIAPLVQASGYQVGAIDNASVSDLRRSVVMWAPGQEVVAQNVAKDIQTAARLRTAPRITPIDGATAPNIGDSDVVVVVGLDLARS